MDSWTRRAAVGRSDVGQPALRYALRRILWRDGEAQVRAAAAQRLGRLKVSPAASGSTLTAPSASVEVAAWLGDALGDVTPLVREAALRGLARLAPRLPVLARAEYAKRAALLSVSDMTWWVRRAALLAHAALLSLQAERSLPLLRGRLGDPFWRVRHAAAQALYAIGLRQPELREAIVAPAPDLPGPGQAGLWYLRTRFQPGIEVHAFPTPEVDGQLHNPDPAVVTARLRAQSELSTPPSELLPFFADPHEPLRRLAVERLRTYIASCEHAADGATAAQALLRELLPWLETPSLPHAAETTSAFLDSLGEPAARLCREILRAALPGAGPLRWAAAYAAQTQALELVPHLCRHTEHPAATARAAVLGALLALHPAPDVAPQGASQGAALAAQRERQLAWVRGLADENIEVRSLAAVGLAQSASDPTLRELLWQRPLAELLPAARLSLIESARRAKGRELLTRGLGDSHPLVRAAALRALLPDTGPAATPPGALPEAQSFLRDRDPELRLAALPACPEHWLSLLLFDPDPYVRRAALSALASPAGRKRSSPQTLRQAALAASQASDPWLRTEAAALLDGSDGDAAQLSALLRLSRDAEESVRAAASDGLQSPAIAPHLRDLLAESAAHRASPTASPLSPEQRAAAYAWIALHEGEAASELLRAARRDASEPAAVQAILPSLLFLASGDSDELAPAASSPIDDAAALGSVSTRAPQSADEVAPQRSPSIALRELGRTGLRVAPLGLSGAYDPPLSALHKARRAGVNLFFWEPSYLRLTRFLRRHNQQGQSARGELVIVAGSFEADRVGIERDVARALRRLGTDYLDVLLLLWVRSPERLSKEAIDCLQGLKRRGVIRAFGFSTHRRDLAEAAAPSGTWDVLMLRHSAAHPGAEDRLLPLCAAHGVGVITFSALSYGRLLRPQPASPEAEQAAAMDQPGLGPLPTAAECYRYTLSQPGVSACFSAPRSYSELHENLSVLTSPPLSEADSLRLRRHGQLVRAEDRRFATFLRYGHTGAPETLAQLKPPADIAASPSLSGGVFELDGPPARAARPSFDRSPYSSADARPQASADAAPNAAADAAPDAAADAAPDTAADAASDLLQLLEASAPGDYAADYAGEDKDAATSLPDLGDLPDLGEKGSGALPLASSTSFALALGRSFLSRRRKSDKM